MRPPMCAFLGPVKIKPNKCNAYTAQATYRFKDFLPTLEDERRGVAPSLRVGLNTNGDGEYYRSASRGDRLRHPIARCLPRPNSVGANYMFKT